MTIPWESTGLGLFLAWGLPSHSVPGRRIFWLSSVCFLRKTYVQQNGADHWRSLQDDGADYRTPVYRTPLIENYDVSFQEKGIWGSLTSWEDADGTRWILAPMWGPIHPDFKFPITNGNSRDGSIVALKIEGKDAILILSPAWVSRNLIAPTPPVVANGVVFALSSSENVTQTLGSEQRISYLPMRYFMRSTLKPARNSTQAAIT